ncbi:hypothetical protein M430DRAFT_53800 [Amorphotheca resinae ATCC 22711]|uniref:Uncharacterized protein n=1 Tax=Amorphotheca resinae ATCC 22711 TaxID=857342 RepID=A0A2T3ASC4_AMORE|nr:hypothetical protein M430DRAFT_53800 [Amorphotheca resinae ATCC 22711]PSS09275.1 hypothetical protein M430DRAFT_53800 [Amorphotheca resinae ATCC 22711]
MDHPRLSSPQCESQSDASSGIGYPAYFLEGFPEGTEIRQFTNILSVRKRSHDRHIALLQDKTQNPFLIFTDVPDSEFLKICEKTPRTSRTTRILYSWKTHTLILKIMPYIAHETAKEELKLCIGIQITTMGLGGELYPIGQTTIRFGDFTKEPDGGWARLSQNPNPSFVLEIGLSESSGRLVLDARGWLESTGSTVQIAVTIMVNRKKPEIVVQRWEIVPRVYSVRTRASHPPASCTQEVRSHYLNQTILVTGGLVIPFNKVVGRPANQPLEQDFVITRQDLEDLSRKVWTVQKFL